VLIKFNAEELAALNQYENGPFGESSFDSFMAEIHAQTNQETGEVDLDRDERERIATHRRQGFGTALDAVFKRPMEGAFKVFFE